MNKRPRLRVPSLPTAISLLALSIVITGTAWAATGQIVNIGDRTNAANLARVSAAGSLQTTATISGAARPAPPLNPVDFGGTVFQDQSISVLSQPSSATVAISGVRIANPTTQPATVVFRQWQASGGECAGTSHPVRWILGNYRVPAGQTVIEPLTTPLVVKPPYAGGLWCFVAFATGTSGEGMSVQFNGYVVSGSFPSGRGSEKNSLDVPSR